MTLAPSRSIPDAAIASTVLFVDPAVMDAQILLDGRSAGMEVHRLENGRGALDQIAQALRYRRGIRELHILSHGEPGALILCGTRIDDAAVAAHRPTMETIASTLGDDSTVILYGCSIAEGTVGQAFIEGMELVLGARVAASVGPVGAASLGGSWDLRVAGGESVPAGFTAASRAAFPGLLASTTGTVGNDNLSGTTGNDDISGIAGNDTISALDGDDSLFGGDGNDTLYGGGGADTLYGGTGNDFLYGQTGNDLMYADVGNDGGSGGDGDDTIYGGDGNDTLAGNSGSDRLFGGAGGDWLQGGKANDIVYGGANNDTISGGDGQDSLYGEAGNDTLSGHSGSDLLYGGAGNDLLKGGANADTLSGGAGNDSFSGSVTQWNGDTVGDFSTDDMIIVTSKDLTSLNGTATSGTIDLGGGASITLTGITAASGTWSAVLNGTSTEITYSVATNTGGSSGGSSGDSAVSNSETTTTNSSGATVTTNTITNNGTGSGSAAIVQNTTNNGNVVTATLPSSVSLTSEGPATAQSTTDAVTTLVNAIDARDSAGETELVGGAQTFLNRLASTTMLDVRTIVPTLGTGITNSDPIVISGTGLSTQSEAFVIDMRSAPGKILQLDNIEFASIIGSATVNGGAGNNYAIGDDSAQFISLGEGDDTLYGGAGNDTIASADGNDALYGDGGLDTVVGGSGNDTVWGGADSDVVYGNTDNDVVYGNQSSDTVYGGQANDLLYGGQGDDLIYGNLDYDKLIGGAGNDTMYGGSGEDTFVVGDDGDVDVIADFSGADGDRIAFTANLNGTAIDTFEELAAAATETDGNVQFDLGSGNALTLIGVTTADLQSDWFTFG